MDDVARSGAVVADMRKIIRQDPRIIQKLHRRVFLDEITRDQVSIYISCYVEAPNRDAFMAVKQDLLLAFIDCVERNGARLARNRLQVCFCQQGMTSRATPACMNITHRLKAVSLLKAAVEAP